MWWIGAFLAGLPLGLLAACVVDPSPGIPLLLAAAGVAGALLAAAVVALARASSWDAERERHLGRAATAGWLALPALATAWLDLPPGALASALGIVAVLAAALLRASRTRSAAPGLSSHGLRLAGGVVLASVLFVALAGVLSALGGTTAARGGNLAQGAWDVDAGVAMREEPRCAERVGRSFPLADRGAHPRLSPDGARIWFDALAPGGTRQIYRLDRSTGSVRCWTCDEPGNNRRPHPHPRGSAIVFDTDRHRGFASPTNTEVHAMTTRDGGPGRSRRLTHTRGPDDHVLYDPSGRGIVWSRAEGAGFRVVRAPIQAGHGGLLLGGETRLASGGARWVTPLAWSPDARSLVIGRGTGGSDLEADVVDPATGERFALGGGVAGPGAVSYSADGSRVIVATTRPSGAASLVPTRLGFLLGRLRAATSRIASSGRGGSAIRLGPSRGELREVALGELAGWGRPAGVSLHPDGTAFVLAQQRRTGGRSEERLLWAELDCTTADLESAGGA